MSSVKLHKYTCWLALACLVVPMFGQYFFDDMFSSISYLFNNPAQIELGWDSTGYGLYAGGYSTLCIFGGLIVCGILLDKWGVRITGSIFVGLMTAGAALVTWAISSGMSPGNSLSVAYAGVMIFGLGSEITGVAVNRSIAKWFKDGPMAFAMGLQLAIARLGTAAALLLSPKLVAMKAPGEMYTLSETARPAYCGLLLLLAGCVLWAVFVAMDARFDRNAEGGGREQKSDEFHFRDVLDVLRNRNFIIISLLCVFFYSSIVAFKKFAGAILVPRFDIAPETASMMVSMLPFATVIFAPLFGIMVDRMGNGTKWMVAGAVLALAAHLLLTFAPQGVPFWGYLSMVLLGFGYSLVPAAMWPSVPRIVPAKVLGTAFSLVYWVQNLGLMLFKMLAGVILGKSAAGTGPLHVELMFLGVCTAALLLSWMLRISSSKHPELKLD